MGAIELDQIVEQMKRDIMIDVQAERVPRDVGSFQELHYYVDANWYGGFTEDPELMPLDEDALSLMAAAQVLVDRWIAAGHLQQRH